MAVADLGKFRNRGVHLNSTHARALTHANTGALTYARTVLMRARPHSHQHARAHTHTRACAHTYTHTHTHTQFNETAWNLGRFAVEADAAAARDSVAKVIGYRLNFKKPRKITGQRSNGADQAVADAVKAANAFVLGNSMTFGGFGQNIAKIQTITLQCSDDPSSRHERWRP